MAGELEASKFIWDIFTQGGKLDVSDVVVNVLPVGTTKMDLNNWKGPVSYPETFNIKSWIFHSDLADLTLTARWEYNGQYIASFNVMIEGEVAKLSDVSVRVQTFDGSLDEAGVAQMEYHITVKFENVAAGTKTKTYRAMARGDGGGMSLA